MKTIKKILTAVSAIDDVLNSECVYVDKTAYIHKLITCKDRLFFISRPRRFGKSLMLSTLKAIFEGRRELFEGTAISKTDYDWPKHPVLYFDMSDAVGDSIESVKIGLNTLAMSAAEQLKLDVTRNDDPSQTFLNFWNAVEKKQMEVVVLVDEYDVPLQGFLSDHEKLEPLRKAMHDFYVRFKSRSGSIKFLMMTGVTKLTNLSVFSGLNNPIDLTMDPDYAGMLGYTHEELEANFREHIDEFAAKEGVAHQVIYDKLLEWYDNYRFSPESDVNVVNPVSVGLSLSNRVFRKYWNATGTPTMIIEALMNSGKIPAELDGIEATVDQLDVCDAFSLPPIPLLYQCGYLTIDKSDGELLELKIPNEEVRSAIVNGHINSILGYDKGAGFTVASIKAFRSLKSNDLPTALQIFRSAIAALPYEWLIKDEGAVKVAFLDFFNGMRGAKLGHETQTSNGRIDAIIETPIAVYIFEFKYNHSAQEAFDQIIEKHYHDPYLAKGKPIYGIGLNFNPTEGSRGIDNPVVGEIKN